MRSKRLVAAGSCRCDANKPKRPSNTLGGPGTPACANMRRGRSALRRPPRVQELRIACRRPSTRAGPPQSCRTMPAAHASACASRPSSFPAPYAMPNGENNPVGWKPRRWNCPGATTPTRHAISFAIAIARIASRPVTARVSDSASAAATDGLLMCTIDSLCVSSNSSA